MADQVYVCLEAEETDACLRAIDCFRDQIKTKSNTGQLSDADLQVIVVLAKAEERLRAASKRLTSRKA